MDQTWTAVLCVTLAFLSGADSVRLLIGRRGGIIYFHDTETQAKKLLVTTGRYISSLDYHYSKGYLYYSKLGNGIKRRSFGPNFQDSVNITPHKDVYGIAVDWVNDKLYWTRSVAAKVEKADLHGNNQTTIITRDELFRMKNVPIGIDIYGIEVDPFERTLFMIAGGFLEFNGTLIRSDLEGRNISSIAHNKYKFTSYFTIDRPEKQLYVAVADQHVIYSCNYNGELIKEFSVCPNIRWLVPLSVFRQNVYMSDRSNKDNRLLVETLPTMKCLSESLKSDNFSQYGEIYSIKVYDADIQQPSHANTSYQRIKQRFSNWDKCSLLSTELERIDCLEIAPMVTYDKNGNQKNTYNLYFYGTTHVCSFNLGSESKDSENVPSSPSYDSKTVPSSHSIISDDMLRSGF